LNSRSDLIWRIVRSMAMSAVEAGQEPCADTTEAIEYMNDLQLGSWNRIGRAGIAINKDVLQDTIQKERGRTSAGEDISVEELVKIGRPIMEQIRREQANEKNIR
jgi:hypothetical protein